MEQGGKRALRFGKNAQWKAVQLRVNKKKNSKIMLYNLTQDPEEKNDLSKKYPEMIDYVKKTFTKEHQHNEKFSFSWEK